MLRGIVIFIVLVVFLLAQGPQAWNTARSWLGFDDWRWWERDAVTAPERAKEFVKKGLREQLISFEEGLTAIEYRTDGRSNTQRYDLYVVGVGQLTLGKPESNEKVEKVVVTGSRIKVLDENRPDANTLPTEPISGQFNNVIVFDRRAGDFTKLFDKRIAVSEFQYGWRTKPEVLIVFATDRDSDKNGRLDDDDLQDVYIFTFADKKLHKIEMESIDPDELINIPDADFVVIKARRDRNKDGRATGRYDRDAGDPEPSVLIRIDLKTMKASSFLPDTMIEDLQRTLDGSKSAAASPAKE
jgi:hypothetical protein